VVIAPIVGPTLGGWLTDNLSWRWAFYINLPVGVLAVLLISLLVEDPPYIRAARPGRIDAMGFGLMALWLGTLQITLDKGQEADWFGAEWLRWFVLVSAVSMLGFVVRELLTQHPIVNLRVFRDRNFAVGCLLYALFGTALYAMIALQPLFLQTLMGYTALEAGLTVSPRGLGAVLALFAVGVLVNRVSEKLLVAFGFAVFGVSSYLLSQINLQSAMGTIVPANIINGFGSGFVFVPLTTLALGTLGREQMGNATGIQNLLRNIGGSVGLAIVSTMLQRDAQTHRALMVGHLSPLNPEYQHRLGILQRLFESHFNPADALERARAAVEHLLVQQANYWSFVDLFYQIVWLCGGCVVLVLLFRKVQARPGAVPAEM
jgi:DHA2 family multidrug resistance protein